MRFHPRHILLIAIILGLLVFNVVRAHRAHQRQADEIAALQRLRSQSPQSPAWSAFDAAAALRDAPDAQFKPAFDAFRAATEGDNASPAGTDVDQIVPCKTWLLFYRQPDWRDRARPHVQGCMQFHRDTTA